MNEIPTAKSNLTLLRQAIPSLHLTDSYTSSNLLYSIETGLHDTDYNEVNLSLFKKDEAESDYCAQKKDSPSQLNLNQTKDFLRPGSILQEKVEDEQTDLFLTSSLLRSTKVQKTYQNKNRIKKELKEVKSEVKQDQGSHDDDDFLEEKKEELPKFKAPCDDLKPKNVDVSSNNMETVSSESFQSFDLFAELSKFKCGECDEEFYFANELKRHRIIHEYYKCSLCQKQYSEACHLECHTKLRHKMHQFYTCDFCCEKFLGVRELGMHMKVHATEVKKCLKCHRVIKIIEAESHKCPSYECYTCGKKFNFEVYLNKHKKKFHANAKKSGKNLKCHICGRPCKTRSSWTRHVWTHFNVHKCRICNRRYANSESLKAHKLLHKDGSFEKTR